MTPRRVREVITEIEPATSEDRTLRDLFVARLDAWPTDTSTIDQLLDDLDRLLGGTWFSDSTAHQKVFRAIADLAESVSQLDGMTVNERLGVFGLVPLWDASSAEGKLALRRKLRAA